MAVDRTEGYVTEIPYTSGYFDGLNVVRAELAFLAAGLRPPRIETACELGCGNGLSLAIHAAAGPAMWHANDINPLHLESARRMIAASGAEVRLYADSFAEFAGRDDLPKFDFIGLHGVWSWVSDASRSAIVSFISRHLGEGGVVYAGYNVLPGWNAMVPVRHLMTQHASRAAPSRPLAERIDAAFEFAESVLRLSDYSAANPAVVERLATEKASDHRELAHEYFNRDWRPMYFSEVANLLEPAGLTYACSARFLDDLVPLALTPRQADMVKQITDPMLRQSTFDFLAGRLFRRDYWVRGATGLSSDEREAAFRRQQVVLCSAESELPWKARAALTLNGGDRILAAADAVRGPLLDGRARSLAELGALLQHKGISTDDLLPALLLLEGAGIVAPAQESGIAMRTADRCRRLNSHLLRGAARNGDVKSLASPVTGGGVPVGRLDQLFAAACGQGIGAPAGWSEYAVGALSANDTSHSYAPEEIAARAATFAERLPLLRRLQVV